MLKKIINLVIVLNLFISYFYVITANIDEEQLSQEEFLQVVAETSDEPILNSRIAVAYDRKSGNVIWGKNEYKKSAMASTTKIMTALLVIENCDLNQTITVSR